MKKHFVRLILAALAVSTVVTSCGPSNEEKAQKCVLEFFRMLHEHQYDSLNTVYPDFDKIVAYAPAVIKDNKCDGPYSIGWYNDNGDGTFTVLAYGSARETSTNQFSRTFYVKKDKNKNYYIYDSDDFLSVSKGVTNKLVNWGVAAKDEVENSTDQGLIFMFDEYNNTRHFTAEKIRAAFATGLSFNNFTNGIVSVENNTKYNLYGLTVKIRKKDGGMRTYTDNYIAAGTSCNFSAPDGYVSHYSYKDYTVEGSDDTFLNGYYPTGKEYEEYLASKEEK